MLASDHPTEVFARFSRGKKLGIMHYRETALRQQVVHIRLRMPVQEEVIFLVPSFVDTLCYSRIVRCIRRPIFMEVKSEQTARFS